VRYGGLYLCDHIRSFTISATLGFLASYELLRWLQGRVIAAVVCLVLATSPIFFVVTTRGVGSDLPYFFTSMLTLLLVMRLDATRNSRARAVLWLLCGVSLVTSLLIRAVGISLLGGLVAWLAVSRFAKREVRLRRLRTFCSPLARRIIRRDTVVTMGREA
jgi:4-amino-4-deoxy-L-arabinose transferase-like glycosyltransferase